MHVTWKRMIPWLGLGMVLLASGCPASPADVTLREVDAAPSAPDASAVADASAPDASDPDTPDAAADTPDAAAPPIDARQPDAGAPQIEHYGEYTDLLGSGDYPQDKLIMQSVNVSLGGELAYIGIIIRGLSGTSARLALYRESASRPSTLVAATGIFTTQPGRNERQPIETVALEPGRYWIGMNFADATGVSQSAVMEQSHIADIPFGGALPSQLTGTEASDLPLFNLYIGIQH